MDDLVHWQSAPAIAQKGLELGIGMEYDLDEITAPAKTGPSENPFTPKIQHFLESVYKRDIERLAEHYPQKRSLVIDFRELEKFDVELADELLDNPAFLLEACQAGVQAIDLPLLEAGEFNPRVRFTNLPRDREKLIRNLSAEDLAKFISVEGIVRQITDVMPKLVVASWQCRHCGNTYKTPQDSNKVRQPAFCECRHRDFVLVPEQSQFVDYQKIQIQEPLEKLRGNEQAGTLDVFLTEDLVNRITAGDKTRFYGTVELVPNKEQKTVYGRMFMANNLEETQREFDEIEISPEEELEIRELSKNPKIYDLLVNSVAPSIYGHENVKEAIVLQMFGGARKHIPGNPMIRGNIHVLLIGDPGTGKSQILQATKDIAPKSIYVAGKTTSGVGLCVAPETLILNSDGLKPISEFVESHFDEKQSREEIAGAFSNPFEGQAQALDAYLSMGQFPIEKIWRIKAPKKMFKIQTRTGRSLSLTPATSLIRIKDGQIEWTTAADLQTGDFVATPRQLPEGKKINVPAFTILAKNPNVKIGDNLAPWLKEITDRLLPRYGSLQAIALKIGKSRDTMYAARNPKFAHGWELAKTVELAHEAGFSDDEISPRIQTLFISHGKTFHIPRYLDNEKLAYLAGLALGDGNLTETEKSSSLRIFSADPQILETASAASQELFGIFPEYFNDQKRVPGIRIKFKGICELIKAFGFTKRKNEITLAHTATEMPNRVLAATLRGLFDTDGYVSKSTTASPHVGLSTISPRLAETLQLALLKFGIVAKKRLRKKAGQVTQGKIIRATSRFDQYCIEIRGKENLRRFCEHIGFALNRKQQALEYVISRIGKEKSNVDLIPEIRDYLIELDHDWKYKNRGRTITRAALQKQTIGRTDGDPLKTIAHADVFWDRIETKTEFAPDYQWVYDFTVKDHHNFIANGFFVHNTASAVKDDFGEGGWTLKAGALVLASGGMCMADELDKLDDEDRSAMHEAMEQGMISVAKAGIVTRFHTDTSVLAAANPKFSRFDSFTPFIDQINLPPTLISRFDLFFMIRDVLDRTKDEQISHHILMTQEIGELLLQNKKKGRSATKEQQDHIRQISTPPVPPEIMRKFISFARQNIFPMLTPEASTLISDFYVNLRDQGKREGGTYAATHRQLEGLVRLSEASARVRLSDSIDKADAERAIRLLRNSLEDVVKDPTTGKIDFDIIASGQSMTQQTNMKKVLSIIRTKAAEMDMVPIADVVEEAKNQGIPDDRVREILDKLANQGDIYKPRHQFVKPTQHN